MAKKIFAADKNNKFAHSGRELLRKITEKDYRKHKITTF